MSLRIIKYGASWCCQCKQQDKEFDKVSLPENISLIKRDIDDMSDDEVEKLNIKAIPVIVLQSYENDEWIEIHRWNSLIKIKDIIEYVKSL